MTIATSQPETNNSASGKKNVTTDFPITAPAANPVFYRTYSRKLPAGRESWEQVNTRNLDGLKKLGGLNEAEINSFNKTVNGKDIEATRLAIQGLNARYKNNVGDDPSLQSANNPSSANAPGYRSWAEVTAAMNDERYGSDDAYRADVQNKLNNSRL